MAASIDTGAAVAGLAAATAAEVFGSAVRPLACAFISCLTVPVGCAPRATQCWKRSSSMRIVEGSVCGL